MTTWLPAVLFEDEDLLALNKPAGLLVLPDRWDAAQPNLLDRLNTGSSAGAAPARYYVVHRIDRDTSGVLLFARNPAAHRALSMQFSDRRVRKTYEALLEGALDGEMGMIDQPLAPDPRRRGAVRVDAAGKPAQTEYHLLARGRGFSWVRAFPRTGRTHQLRVYFAALGHPLGVDPLYGRCPALYRSDLTGGPRTADEPPLLGRLSLHAAELEFVHPRSGRRGAVAAPLPEDLRRTRAALEAAP